MYPLLSDARFNSIIILGCAIVAAIPLILTAYWSKQSSKNSKAAAKEVMTNGGMTDPNPNINDHIKYNTEMLEGIVQRQLDTEKLLGDHIGHSRIMDQGLAEVYLHVMSKKLVDEDPD